MNVTIDDLTDAIRNYQIENEDNPSEIKLHLSDYYNLYSEFLLIKPNGQLIVNGILINVNSDQPKGEIGLPLKDQNDKRCRGGYSFFGFKAF